MSSALGASQSLQFLPSGAMVDFAGAVAPAGWLMCDGSAVSRTVYASLFASVGTGYGTGDGSTTFNLPDFRGRFARYNDNMGTVAGAAGRDTGRVHGSIQAQATAKNGLSVTNNSVTTGTMNSNTSHSHTTSLGSGSYAHTGGFGGVSAGGTSAPSNSVNIDHTHSITSNVVLNAGDTETRPVNLSCNRIIKY
jgi:microcystin-dependent protein